MTHEAIAELLKDARSWIAASESQREAFVASMKGRQYGWDALTQAWAWFLFGYQASATFIEGSGGVTEADMAAFGASYYACYKYPGKDQSKERAAFCEGVAYSALSGAGVTEGMTPEELIAEHSQGHPKLRENCPTCLASPVSRSPSAGGGGSPDLIDTLSCVCNLIDGWRSDSVWSDWDEEVRWKVHTQLALLTGGPALSREAFDKQKDFPKRGDFPDALMSKAREPDSASWRASVREYLHEAAQEVRKQAEALTKFRTGKFWLWKNGRHDYIAFDNPNPCASLFGDPLTLGEPVGRVSHRVSVNGKPEVSEQESIDAMERARFLHDQPMNSRALPQPSREETTEGWRDIASAPKDGTLIVGYIPDSAARTDELLMEWDEEDGAWRQMGTHSSFLVDVEPSHWMPLPAPPHKESARPSTGEK